MAEREANRSKRPPALDPTFGGVGYVHAGYGRDWIGLSTVEEMPDGTIVAGGYTSAHGGGTLVGGDGGSGWYRLTPDIHGSYINGTWSPIASTRYTRLFYSSDVLTSGNVYVAGGEYGTGRDRAEMYNPLNDTWTEIPRPTSSTPFSASTIWMC